METRVLLADDHELVLDGLCALLEREPGLVVIGRATDGPAAVERARMMEPDVVIMDLSMPGMSGTQATQRIKSDRPETRIICLSMHAQEQFVVAAIQAGASGYILKDRAVGEVIQGIRAVMCGQMYFCPTIAKLLERSAKHVAK